ncbi:SRPBCC family protein [Arthrobacter sp.]|uniref:SRPBCC family protein n=1 Tax=Arthrobacter sp. TaxID=1667 RepID=UPI0028118B6B|nr:SRPBCC family protein [Arthrobacter sp.]
MHSRHISVVINRAQAEVYDFAADPAHLPEWAGGLAQSDVTREGNVLFAASPMGRISFVFAPRNDYGVLDHKVTLPSGNKVNNPLRVIDHPEGSEVIFTLRQMDLTDEEFGRDAKMVEADLERLKTLLES